MNDLPQQELHGQKLNWIFGIGIASVFVLGGVTAYMQTESIPRFTHGMPVDGVTEVDSFGRTGDGPLNGLRHSDRSNREDIESLVIADHGGSF